ncbi:MAG: sugar phosphate isomerase/epimerase [Clostridia bacterium]|nr:sugar phosphate isomerase/epimerase [Clostridia bacterium]
MYRIGISSCGAPLTDELFADYKRAGVDAIEISIGRKPEKELDYAEIKRLSDTYGIELWSFHLPFAPFSEFDLSRPDLCDHTVEYFKGLIDEGAKIGIKRFVVHPSGEPVWDDARQAQLECSKRSLARLAEYAKGFGGVICVEDLPRSCIGRNSDEMLELLSAHEDLRSCFDTNHLLSLEKPHEYIRKIGNKIVTLHVSDYDFLDERHWLPGEGDIDWAALYEALCEVGYSGVWMYELGLGAPNSIVRERELTRDDFVTNAREIFDGKPLTVCGKRVDGLIDWIERYRRKYSK